MGRKIAATRYVWGISDLHVDSAANWAWLKALEPRPMDTIIVAGDIANSLGVLEKALQMLIAKFQHVFYCPGTI